MGLPSIYDPFSPQKSKETSWYGWLVLVVLQRRNLAPATVCRP